MKQNSATPGIWNPLSFFDTVRNDGELANVQSVTNFYAQAKQGTLPAVSWVVPSGEVSEHPPAPVTFGQSLVISPYARMGKVATRRCRSTRTTSSSKTCSSAVSASTPRPTAAPILVRPSART